MQNEWMMSIATLILRVTVGVIFTAHGLQKTLGYFGGPGIAGVTGMVEKLGFTPPVVWAWVLALSEGLGGLFLVLGIFPRVSATAIAIAMAVAIYKIHGAKGLFAQDGGFEYPLLILGVCIFIMIAGAGKIALFNKL